MTPGSCATSVSRDSDAAKRLTDLAAALASTGAVRRLTLQFSSLGIPTLMLKGPPVQERLLGRLDVYRSADIDILVPRMHAATARRHMKSQGWRFLPENSTLWRLDRAAAFGRAGVSVDLHWGLHLHMVAPPLLAPLEEELWKRAEQTDQGWFDPAPEPLLVYLAANAAGKRFSNPAALRLIAAASDLVRDWRAVEEIARRCRLERSVEYALAIAKDTPQTAQPNLLDGGAAAVYVAVATMLRKQIVPAPLRSFMKKRPWQAQ